MLSLPKSLEALALGAVLAIVVPGYGIASASHSITHRGQLSESKTGSMTDAPRASCFSTRRLCSTTMLSILNHQRSRHHLPLLHLSVLQSFGNHHCSRSFGHTVAMARSGDIWHINPSFPRASFPKDICGTHALYGENAGWQVGYSIASDLRRLEAMMMAEPHSRRQCATASAFSHACNILNPAFRRVGIGIYQADGATWLTEDFTS